MILAQFNVLPAAVLGKRHKKIPIHKWLCMWKGDVETTAQFLPYSPFYQPICTCYLIWLVSNYSGHPD